MQQPSTSELNSSGQVVIQNTTTLEDFKIRISDSANVNLYESATFNLKTGMVATCNQTDTNANSDDSKMLLGYTDEKWNVLYKCL